MFRRVYVLLRTRVHSAFIRTRMRKFERYLQVDSNKRIIDLGGTAENWRFVESAPHVTLLNREHQPETDGFDFVLGDATDTGLPDASFDIAYSNSVIEHLPPSQRVGFAREVTRLAPALWIQTPARGFPFEPHLMGIPPHFFPSFTRRWALRWLTIYGLMMRPDRAGLDRTLARINLLTYAEFAALFPDCTIMRERFFGLTKCFIARRTL
jgi:hypothetical protein